MMIDEEIPESPPKTRLEFAQRIEKMVEKHRDEMSPELVKDLLETAENLRRLAKELEQMSKLINGLVVVSVIVLLGFIVLNAEISPPEPTQVEYPTTMFRKDPNFEILSTNAKYYVSG